MAGQEEVDSFRALSPDFKGSSRTRTDTGLQRKIKTMKGDSDQVKIINWKSPVKDVPDDEDLFPRKDIKKPTEKFISKLSQQLALDNEDNPWKEYGM